MKHQRLSLISFFFLFSFFLAFFPVSLAGLDPAFGEETVGNQAAAPEMSQDIYYKTEGPVSGPPAPKMKYPDTYGRSGGWIDNRSLLWIFTQQHFFLGSFILGVPMIAWMLELFSHARRKRSPERSSKLDRLAQEIMQIGLPFYPLTIFFGIALLGAFLFLFSEFFKYMVSLF